MMTWKYPAISRRRRRAKTALPPGEQTHILIPGGRKLFIGTPHTHDSLYDEVESMGADCLTIKLFDKEKRIEAKDATQLRYVILSAGVCFRWHPQGRAPAGRRRRL
jgi:hypothetical protein